MPLGQTAPPFGSCKAGLQHTRSQRLAWHKASSRPAGCVGRAATGVCQEPVVATHSDEAPLQTSRPRPPTKAVVPAQVIHIHRQAKTAQLAGRQSEALAVLQQGLQQYPSDRHLLSLAASLAVKAGRPALAQQYLYQGLTHHPGHLAFVMGAAQLEARRGRVQAARALLQSAAKVNRRNAAVLQALGDLEAAAGDSGAARKYFAAACRVEPYVPHTYTAWARMEASQGAFDQARQLFSKGARACSGNAPLLHAWAEMELDLGRVQAAKQLLEQAMQADAHHVPTYMLLGQVEWVSGRCTQAREIWRRGNMTPLGPSAPLLCYWAQRELRLQNLGAARDLLAQAQAADPHHAHSAALAASLEDRARTSGARMQSSGPQRTARQQPVAHAGEKQQDSGIVQGSPGDTLPPSVADLSSTQASQQGGGSGRQLPDGGHTAIAMAGGAATALEGQEGSSSQGGAVSQPGTVSNAGGGSRHESPAALHARAQSLLARGRREEAEQVLALLEQQAPGSSHLCHTRGVMAQQQGDVPAAKAWFLRGVRCAGQPLAGSDAAPDAGGVLMCWEGYAELLAFLGQRDAARRAFQAGAASALRVQYMAAAALGGSSVIGSADEETSTGQGPGAWDTLSPLLQQFTASQLGSTSTVGLTQSSNGKTAATTETQSHSQHLNRPGKLQHSSRGTQREHQMQQHNGHSSSDGTSHATTTGSSSNSTNAADSLLKWVETGMATVPELNPNYPGCTARFLRQWALLEKKLGSVEEAGRLFAAAAHKDPQDYKTWLAWAVLSRRAGQLDKAQQAFRRAAAVAPGNPHIWYAYSNMLWRAKGDVAEAREVLKKATSLCPRAATLWLEWALLEWQGARDVKSARALLERGSQVPPSYQNALLYEAWAQLEAEQGAPPERVRDLNRQAEALQARREAAAARGRTPKVAQ